MNASRWMVVVVTTCIAVGTPQVAPCEPFAVAATGRWQTFDVATQPGWRLRARCTRFQSAALTLHVLDERGLLVADTTIAPALITGGTGRRWQMRPPTWYLDPIRLRIDEFRPGTAVAFDLDGHRLAYARPPRPLEHELRGLRPAPGDADLPANASLDPLVTVRNSTSVDRTKLGDGRFTILRYYVASGRHVSQVGYIAVDHHRRTWYRLLTSAPTNDDWPEGVLFADALLALRPGPRAVPELFETADEGLVPVPLPQADLLQLLPSSTVDELVVSDIRRSRTAAGTALALTFVARSSTGAILVRARIAEGALVSSSRRPLTPSERLRMVPTGGPTS